ncbi:transposase domain-containing protein, partial [Puniceibacterium confluentis]|uniref:transposase domain-containing protein n=1 Tax=Puniceibacterium confluentis TaxID=1958944 RepID=UPI001FE9BCCC
PRQNRHAIDNEPDKPARHGQNEWELGIGRKNWLFAGADTGAETLARAMTVIETAKLNGLDPRAYLADILDRIHDHKINRLDELLPWNWAPLASAMASQAA